MAGLDTLSKLLAMQTQMQNQQNQKLQMDRQAQIDAFNMQKYNDTMRQQQLTNTIAQQEEARKQALYSGQRAHERQLADLAGRYMGQGGDAGPEPARPMPGLTLDQTNILASGQPGALDFIKTLKGIGADDQIKESVLLNNLYRGLGADIPFLIHEYAKDGLAPTTMDDWQSALSAAKADTEYSTKRQNWQNTRTAGNYKNLGVSLENPGYEVWQNPKDMTTQLRPISGGDVYDRKLKQQTAEMVDKNSAFLDLRSNIENLQTTFNPDNVGPFDYRMKSIGKYFKSDPEFITMERNIKQGIRLAYALSGKQISAQELDRLSSTFLPDPTLEDTNYQQSLSLYRDYILGAMSNYNISLKNSRYYVPNTPELEGIKGKALPDVDELIKEVGSRGKPQVNYEELYARAYAELGKVSDEVIDAKVDEYLQGAK